MHFWDYSFDQPEANLAFDEALLEYSDSAAWATADSELLRLWELQKPCIVVGRSSRVSQEVNQVTCMQDQVPILRRMSGGASIVAGPGCLMFSLLLSLRQRPECRGLDGAHRTVMTRMQRAVQSAMDTIGSESKVEIQGICDLTIAGRKISGNALRVKRDWLIYHGTLLIDMPLHWIERYLLEPPKQPEYRQRREHREFVESLGRSLEDRAGFLSAFQRSLRVEWNAQEPWTEHPFAAVYESMTLEWIQRRYSDPAWHMQR
jgi:lipoate-protein ligase A